MASITEMLLRRGLNKLGLPVDTIKDKQRKRASSLQEAMHPVMYSPRTTIPTPNPYELDDNGEEYDPGVTQPFVPADISHGRDIMTMAEGLQQSNPKLAEQLLTSQMQSMVNQPGHRERMLGQKQNLDMRSQEAEAEAGKNSVAGRRLNFDIQKYNDGLHKEGYDQSVIDNANMQIARQWGFDPQSPHEAATIVQIRKDTLDDKQKRALTASYSAQALRDEGEGNQFLADEKRDEHYAAIAQARTGGKSQNPVMEGKRYYEDAIENTETLQNNYAAYDDGLVSLDKVTRWLNPTNEMGGKIRKAIAESNKLKPGDILGVGSPFDEKLTVYIDHIDDVIKLGGVEEIGELRSLQLMLTRLMIPEIKPTIGDARFTQEEAKLVLNSVTNLFSGNAVTVGQVNESMAGLAKTLHTILDRKTEGSLADPLYQQYSGYDINGETTLDFSNQDEDKPRWFRMHNAMNRYNSAISKAGSANAYFRGLYTPRITPATAQQPQQPTGFEAPF